MLQFFRQMHENALIRKRLFSLQARYYWNKITGKAVTIEELKGTERFRELYLMLRDAFEDFDPAERDVVKSIYAVHKIFPPSEPYLKRLAAEWAAEVVLVIESMTRGLMAPAAFKPLITPLELDYYEERLATYLEWLASPDAAVQKIPVPFFYAIAAERLSHVLREQTSPAPAPALEKLEDVGRIPAFQAVTTS